MPRGIRNNLIPLDERSPEEVKRITSMGGKASGEARQEKARLRKIALAIADLQAPPGKERDALLAMGFSEDEITNDKLLVLSLLWGAMKGNTDAFREFKKLMGEDESASVMEKLDDVLDMIGGKIDEPHEEAD